MCFVFPKKKKTRFDEASEPIGSMYGKVYSPTFTIKINPNVGEYTSPMDPMGNEPFDFQRWVLLQKTYGWILNQQFFERLRGDVEKNMFSQNIRVL